MEEHEKKELDKPIHHNQNKPNKKNKPLSKSFYLKLYMVLGIAIIIFAGFNIAQSTSFENLFNQKLSEAKKAAIPAKIQLVTINNADCEDCFDIAPVVASLKKANVDITEEKAYEFDSMIAKKLIKKHALEKIPTLLVSGEIDKLNIRDLEKKDNLLIFTKLAPPYTDTQTGEVLGKVSTILLEDSSCKQCNDLSRISTTLKQSGIVIEEQKILESSDQKAQELIEKLGIEKLPAFLISNDINVHSFVEKIKQSGIAEKKGYYVVESPAPYIEVQTGKVRGLVDLTMITSTICPDCYDVKLHQQVFSRMGLAIENEETVDINSAEGIKLRMKYKLEKVPTIILAGDISVYEWFNQIWQRVGTVEDDGTYIFRNVELLGRGIVYQDLKSGETVDAGTTLG